MDKKTSRLFDESFKLADQAFAKADEAFASVDWTKVRSQQAHQHGFEFEAPTWKHRRKLCKVFFTMFWQMLRYGKTQLRINKRS